MKLVISLILALAALVFSVHHYLTGTTIDLNSVRNKKLPVVELPVADAQNDILTVILSGDGGWADLDRDFGNAFQKRGISTLGFDCLKYFWKPRHPQEVSLDLEIILRHYLEVWHKKEIVLVGYSFGASWLPFLVNRLPADLQAQVRLVVLLAPAKYVNVEIKMNDWFRDIKRPGGLTVPEEAAKIRQELLCVYGKEEEAESICPSLKGPNMHIIPRAGGHHFDHDYSPIENAILKSVGVAK
jgi:type IV secretory pathway VirJ component